jgi:hypothetical protein
MSAGGDAVVQDWSEGFGYFQLSVVLVFEVFDKARGDKAQGILVVPDWPGSMMAREIEYCEQLELVARWPGGGQVVRWSGGQVARWGPGGGP